MKKKLTFLLLAVGIQSSVHAQIVGGNSVFEFLNASPTARITALGGQLISVSDDDVGLALSNPAALNPNMHHQVAFNHQFMVADISSGYVGYGQHLSKSNLTLHGAIQYRSYGEFKETDEIGNVIGRFKANEYALNVGAGRQLYERVSVGANLKFITSQLENYTANGIAADFAAMFHDTTKLLSITLAFRNLGVQFQTYTENEGREKLPYESQIGLSKRLRHLPFRISVVYRYLNRWNIRYDDPNSEEDLTLFGEDSADNERPFIDNLARHFVVSGEFLLGKKENFRIRMGYNHLLRKETEIRNLRSLSGFAFGFGFKVKRFRIDFGRSVQHLGAGFTHLGLSADFHKQ